MWKNGWWAGRGFDQDLGLVVPAHADHQPPARGHPPHVGHSSADGGTTASPSQPHRRALYAYSIASTPYRRWRHELPERSSHETTSYNYSERGPILSPNLALGRLISGRLAVGTFTSSLPDMVSIEYQLSKAEMEDDISIDSTLEELARAVLRALSR